MKLEKINALSKADIKKTINAFREYQKFDELIVDRMDYVVRKIAEVFGGAIDWWDWNNGASEVDGHFDPEWLNDYSIQLDGTFKGGQKNWVSCLKNGEWEWEFTDLEIPTYFLTEDFEEDLIRGIEIFEEREKAKKEKNKISSSKRKEEKEKLIKSAVSKLTKEEKKALGIK